MMDIQERLRRYGRDSRLLGGYREHFNALAIDDPEWEGAKFWLERLEADLDEQERELVSAGLMRDADRYAFFRRPSDDRNCTGR